jgi:hypothetical protein
VLPTPFRRALGLSLAFSSIFACYDHRVTQAILERRRVAKQAEGSEIRPTHAGPKRPPKHHATLKIYVAPEVRKQHPEWKESLLDLVDNANRILISSFGLQLEAAQPVSWEPRCDGTDLQVCLEELATLDAGAPDVWVLGVLGSQPQFIDSFDQLGRAALPGSHMVVRDVSDLAERDAIEKLIPPWEQGRRDEIYRHRKQHKRLAVFLHEWAHTMGANHVNDSSSLLFARYDDRMAGFDDEAVTTITAALEPRIAPRAGNPETAVASAQPAVGSRTTPARAASASTSTGAQSSSGTSRSGYAVQGDDQELLAALTPADRIAYDSAAQNAYPYDAYAALEPLVQRYPDCYAVQHLACGLLMQLGRAGDVQTVCNRVQTLASSKR